MSSFSTSTNFHIVGVSNVSLVARHMAPLFRPWRSGHSAPSVASAPPPGVALESENTQEKQLEKKHEKT